jgi:hypothetical protein
MKRRFFHSLGVAILALHVAVAQPQPTPGTAQVIDGMAPADLQQAVQLLKSHYINPAALNETELNRAMLAGILARLGPGVMLLPQGATAGEGDPQLYSDVIDNRIGYVRPGGLTSANLQAFDDALKSFAAKKVEALVFDLRASGASNDFAVAAEFAKRLVPRGKPLFTLRKPAAKQERAFTTDRDPAFSGMMIVLADSDSSGPAEALAAVLRLHNKALVIGQPTAGRTVEYSDLPLNGGRVLRVAVAEAVLPDGRALFPAGVTPDIPVEMPAADKRLVFEQSRARGMRDFVFEAERPHMNEAALIAGRNPELEALEAQRRAKPGDKPLPRDPVVQRAMDLVTSLTIYQAR